MTQLVRRQNERKDQKPELPDEIHMNNYPESLAIWKLMRATDWKHLPYPGSLLEQPDWLISDLLNISTVYYAADRLEQKE